MSGHNSHVIDAHTHVFAPEVCDARHLYLPRDPWFEHLYTSTKAALVPVEAMIASMDDAGIARSIACAFPWRDHGLCRAHNDYLAEVARRFPERISWLGAVVPGDPGAASEAARCFELGAAGIGELNADAQGFDFREPEQLAPLVDVCLEWSKPIMFHVSEPVGHIYPGKGTATPEKFVQFLASYPGLRVVAAHWGGGLPFYELMPEVASLARNVVYDTAASTYLYRFEVFRSVLDVVGPSRVLMGSDYPVLQQRRFLKRVRAAGMCAEELDAVLGANAIRVYDLPEKESTGD